MLFTFPSRYLFTIGLSGVFSLTGWSRWIQTGFLVSRLTQDTTKSILTYVYKTVTFYGRTFQSVPLHEHKLQRGPTTPILPKQYRFGLFPVRSPLLRESRLFSFPAGTKMFQFPAFASIWMIYLQYIGLPHSEIFGSKVICTYPKLIAAYHVLHRL